jgi:hypothetical protein
MTAPGMIPELREILPLLPPDAGDTGERYCAGIMQVLEQSGFGPDLEDKASLETYANLIVNPAEVKSSERRDLPKGLDFLAIELRKKWFAPAEVKVAAAAASKDEKKAPKETEVSTYRSDAVGRLKGTPFTGSSAHAINHAEHRALTAILGDKTSSGDIYLVQNAWPCGKCLDLFRSRDMKGRKVTITVTRDFGDYTKDNDLPKGTTGKIIITNKVIKYELNK